MRRSPLRRWDALRRPTSFFGGPRRTAAVLALLALVPIAAVAPSARAQGSWEMRVCADPDDFPASDRERPGFENRVAEILAEELGADLAFVWTPVGSDTVRHALSEGACDLIPGVAEGVAGLVNSVAYYRAPYVFAYRQDAPFEVGSLSDEALTGLRITTFPNSLLHEALAEYGLAPNVVLPPTDRFTGGMDRTEAILRSVVDGEADVALVYAPDAIGAVERLPDGLRLVPIQPEIVPPLLPMYRIVTFGVRPGDEALRDRINVALARRWDEIGEVFASYGVPLLPLPRPVAPSAEDEPAARVGVVLPVPTSRPAATDVVGRIARLGAVMAGDLIGREVDRTGVALRLFLASAPTTEASIRAAERMIATDGVRVLVGGFGEAEARALGEVAAERGVLFLNVGASSERLRDALCSPTTFHVEASAGMYLDALTGWFAHEGSRRWFLLHDASPEGGDLAERARSAVRSAGGEVVGGAVVEPDQFVYRGEIERLAAASPDAVLLLLDAGAQERFLAQYEVEGLAYAVAAFPTEVGQTRDHYFRLAQSAPSSLDARVVLWETTLDGDGPAAINERFMGSTGEPMDPAAWATYAAVKIAYEALAETGADDAVEALVRYLEGPDASFDVHKGAPLSFRPADHQLRQPLYLVEIDPAARWGMALSNRVAVAAPVGELPALYLPDLSPTERLDRLGAPAEGAACTGGAASED